MPDADPSLWPSGTGDVVRTDVAGDPDGTGDAAADAADVPAAPGDAAETVAACRCCNEGCTTAMGRCPSDWPPPSVRFTTSGFHEPLAPLEGQTSCGACDEFAGLASCLNRDWELPLTNSTTGGFLTRGSSPPIAVLCSYGYEYSCTVPILGDPGPILGPPGSRSVTITAFVEIVIVQDPLLPYREYFVTARFGLSIHPDLASQECFYNSALYSAGGPIEDLDTFEEDETPVVIPGLDCDGPWILTPTNATEDNACGFVDVGGDGATPPTLVVSRGAGTPPEFTLDCCAPVYSSTYDCIDFVVCADRRGRGGLTLEDCLTACSIAESYNCVYGVGCQDPGTGLGTYTGPTALADCSAVCVPDSWDCVGGVCREAWGGPYGSSAECEASGCGEGGGGDRLVCCPGGEAADTLDFFVGIAFVGLCECLVHAGVLAWNVGEQAYVLGVPGACGTFVTYKVRCVDGTWYGEVWCLDGEVEVLLVAVELLVQSGDICFPAPDEFSIPSMAGSEEVTAGAACCAAGQQITFAIRRPFVGGGGGGA